MDRLTIQDTYDSDEKRSKNDRRTRTGISIRMLVGAGKRESMRRQDDRQKVILFDWYSPKLFVTILIVLILSIVDGFLTLFLLEHGAYEVNPIMAYLIDVSPSAFVAVKYSLTCMAALIVLILSNVLTRITRFSAHTLLYFFAGVFMVVVVWELYLISYVI